MWPRIKPSTDMNTSFHGIKTFKIRLKIHKKYTQKYTQNTHTRINTQANQIHTGKKIHTRDIYEYYETKPVPMGYYSHIKIMEVFYHTKSFAT